MIKINFKSALLSAGILCTLCVGGLKAQTLGEAITYTKNEQYDKAEELFQQLTKNDPANSRNYFYYGENTLLNYFSDTISSPLNIAAKEAKALFDKGVAANPAEPLNYVGLARVAFYLGDDAKAEEMRVKANSLLPPYKKVTKIANPKDYAFTLAKIAESYIRFETVDTSKALPFVRHALKIDTKNSEVYIIAGDIYILVNDGSKAIKNYNLAQDWDLQSPTANMKIGSIYVKGRSLAAAIPFYEQAIALNANYAPAYRELGQLYSMVRKYDKSKEYFKKYLELTQGNIPAKGRYVNALFYAKEYKEVIKNVEEIFAVDNSRTYMNRIAGYSAYEEENYDLALSYMEKLFQLLPEDRIIKKDYTYLAKILLKKNQNFVKQVTETESNEADLAEMEGKLATLKGAPKDKLKADIDVLAAKVAESRAQIAKAEAEITRAFDAYEKAIMFDGTPDIKLISEKASYQNVYKKNVDAGDTYSRLLSLGKNAESDYEAAGRSYYMGKAFDKADVIFNQMAEKFPESLQTYYWLANSASAQDPDFKTGLAKPNFEKLLKLASADSVKNATLIFDALKYLGYYSVTNQNYEDAKGYYTRMLNLAPNNNDYKIKAYNLLSTMYLEIPNYPKAIECNNSILEIDPKNESAKAYLDYIQKMINPAVKVSPNQISGFIKDGDGNIIAGASVRVKDTAAEAWTNTKGEYKFVMPEASSVLVVSAKGFQTKEIPVTKSRVYNVTLNK